MLKDGKDVVEKAEKIIAKRGLSKPEAAAVVFIAEAAMLLVSMGGAGVVAKEVLERKTAPSEEIAANLAMALERGSGKVVDLLESIIAIIAMISPRGEAFLAAVEEETGCVIADLEAGIKAKSAASKATSG